MFAFSWRVKADAEPTEAVETPPAAAEPSPAPEPEPVAEATVEPEVAQSPAAEPAPEPEPEPKMPHKVSTHKLIWGFNGPYARPTLLHQDCSMINVWNASEMCNSSAGLGHLKGCQQQ